jgi:hypothetical protein
MARVYRRYIARGLRIYVNNRLTEAVDPTYSMPSARHATTEGLSAKTSRLVVARTILVPVSDGAKQTIPVHIKLYALPIEDWSNLTRRDLTSKLHLFDGQVVSIVRNDRELYAGYLAGIVERHSETHWLRIEIDISGEVDEAFGVAANKQGVRLKAYVTDLIANAIGADISAVREEIRRIQAKRATERAKSKSRPSEARATEADAFQPEQLETPLSAEEKQQMEANLRGLAVALKADGETDDDAYQRVLSSRYLLTFRDDPYWPFYHVEHKFGRVILTINTAHPFFGQLYKPLRDLEIKEVVEGENPPDNHHAVPVSKGPVFALELLLLSMARSQSALARDNGDAHKIFEAFRRSWSESYRIQLTS